MAPQIVANDAAHEPHPSESLQSTADGGTGQVVVDATYSLQRELLRIDAKVDREDFLHELAVVLQVHTDAIWVALIHTNGSQIVELSGNALNYAHFELTCEDAAACALQTQSATYRKLVGAPNAQLVAVPITGQLGECLLATVPDVASEAISLGAFDLAAAHIAFWNENRQRSASEAESQRVAALTELVSHVGFASSAKNACQIIANDLQAYLNCQEVIVGLCQRHDAACEVMAISGARSVDTKSERTRLAEAALQECIVRDGQSTWPPIDAQDRHALCAHRLFSQANDQMALVSMPLRDDAGHSHGAWLIIGDANTVHHERAMTFLQAAEQPLASTIGLLLRAKGNRLEQLVRSAATFAREKKGKVALLIALLVFAILLIPVRYRVSCDCELQPVVRRYIAAPFDGRLEKSYVKPGDVVESDQLLARIDSRDIHWELSGVRAELHRVNKELAGHVAAHESGKAEIVKLELERLGLRIEQLEDQASNLEIRSPIAGIVLLGDLSKSEGVPLDKGQTLFEIAPLHRMVIEVAVPEDDVRFVKKGMATRARLDAFPLRYRDGVIERIHPRAELKDHENVFIAEFFIDNTDGKLRPGMRGKAKVATVKRTLGWNLFHKAYAAILSWFGW